MSVSGIVRDVPDDQADDDIQAAIAGELRLLQSSIRQDPGEVATLLDPGFFEFGASGRRWERDAMIAALADEQAAPGVTTVADVSELAGNRLADGVVLVTYISQGQDRRCRRSSIWRETPAGWRVCFHQGTVIPPPEDHHLSHHATGAGFSEEVAANTCSACPAWKAGAGTWPSPAP
jgi:hypothetical protein